MRIADMAEAAAVLRRFLAALERGELTAGTAHAVAMVRRLEGAVLVLEELSNTAP